MCISASFFVQKPVKMGSDHIASSWNLKKSHKASLHCEGRFVGKDGVLKATGASGTKNRSAILSQRIFAFCSI